MLAVKKSDDLTDQGEVLILVVYEQAALSREHAGVALKGATPHGAGARLNRLSLFDERENARTTARPHAD